MGSRLKIFPTVGLLIGILLRFLDLQGTYIGYRESFEILLSALIGYGIGSFIQAIFIYIHDHVFPPHEHEDE